MFCCLLGLVRFPHPLNHTSQTCDIKSASLHFYNLQLLVIALSQKRWPKVVRQRAGLLLKTNLSRRPSRTAAVRSSNQLVRR